VIELAFVLGVALGTIVTGFCAIGSFDRGYDSVRRRSWSRELAARKMAVRVLTQHAARAAKAADRRLTALPDAFPLPGSIDQGSNQEAAAAS
jgi:hypothetical protein